ISPWRSGEHMKSEFLLAFNQICSERNLPKEVVLEALTNALVSAYRKNANASSAQTITAEIDGDTGLARIYAEKEVVDAVQDERTEVSLVQAHRVMADAKLGDTVMIDSTPADFGRIAAQTAKQVILQRIREAERDAQYAIYSEREGEIINGTVQSISPQGVTLNLGRTEALLPKNQQVPGERYQLHQRIRAYVLEVRKTSRGPQIIVSRNHKNMLRRLLELEVPEIYNGTVEIKSIARESGARSKVAVAAMQAGVDPVGSCVGMRGARIQSIVSELGGEKIDVIEWSADTATYIAKALSPARVLTVQVDEDPKEGKTALVVVPDDQLSLAIGREGQNARLAAKLTGWRIDINGATEGAHTALKRTEADLALLDEMGEARSLVPTLQAVLQRHAEQSLAWNSEELLILRQVIDGQQNVLRERKHIERERQRAAEKAQKAAARVEPVSADAARQEQIAAYRARIPALAYATPLSDVDLSTRVVKHLEKADLTNAGLIHERLSLGDEAMLAIEGIGPKALAEIKQAIETKGLGLISLPEPVPAVEELQLEPAPAVAEAQPEAATAEVTPAVEQAAPIVAQPAMAEAPALAVVEVAPAAFPVAGETFAGEEEEEEEEEIGAAGKKKAKKKSKRKDRKLVFDETLGQVVAVKERKSGRQGEVWDSEDV
ncbi:MAG TPA: transcription termination factor NusA, partial [Anaerolineae bacterium]|nr:transcription termination factor NusA [Anaerolineae bacterium]